MNIAIIGLPRYKPLKNMMLKSLAELEHSFHIFEETGRNEIDGGYEGLTRPKNVEWKLLDEINYETLLEPIRVMDRVVSLSDRMMVLAARLRAYLSLPGNTVETEITINNKAETRSRLRQAGLTSITAMQVDLNDIVSNAAQMQYPFIAKPCSMGASICVEVLYKPEDVLAYQKRCKANRALDGSAFVLEQFIQGQEFSVEGLMIGRTALIYGLTETHTSGSPYFVGTGHDFFTEHPRLNAVSEFIEQIVNALGMMDCPFHIELFDCGDRFEVIEVHSRFPGAMIIELISHGTDSNFFKDYMRYIIEGILSRHPKTTDKISSGHLLTAMPGYIKKISIAPNLPSDPKVLSWLLDYKEGETIPVGIVPIEYAGYINFVANTLEETKQYREEIERSFTIDITPMEAN